MFNPKFFSDFDSFFLSACTWPISVAVFTMFFFPTIISFTASMILAASHIIIIWDWLHTKLLGTLVCIYGEDHSGGFHSCLSSWLWTSYLTFLGYSFLIYKIEVIVAWESPHRICSGWQHFLTFQRWLNESKLFCTSPSLLLQIYKRSYKNIPTPSHGII